MFAGSSQGYCGTTLTERFYNPLCECDTYPGNLGPCKSYEQDKNGRCVYCDHTRDCHNQLIIYLNGRELHFSLEGGTC